MHGAARTYDRGLWGPRHELRLERTLPSLMRKEVTCLAFCPADIRYMYAGGIDNEMQCRRWDVEAPRAAASVPAAASAPPGAGGRAAGFAFRGEARWAGLAVANETVAAYCASGALYAARVLAATEGAPADG